MSTRVDTGFASLARSAPLRWLGWLAVVAAVAAAALWVHLYEFTAPNTWDAALFLTMGKLLRRGLLLYRDLWDTKPPGFFLYESATFAVLPVAVWSLRLTDYLLYVAAGVLFYRLSAVEARWPLALAATVLWLYFAHHPTFNNWGFYTEEYASMGAIAAVAAAVRYWRGGGVRWVAVSGVATAGAVLFKHPGVACGVPVVMIVSARRPLRALPLYALCAALPLLLVVGYFWWHGALADFLDCQVFYLLAKHGVTEAGPGVAARLQELAQRTWERFAPFPVLVWSVAFGGAVCLLRPNRFRLAALAWLLADLLLVGAQKYYYEHYFIQVFASAVLVAVLGAAWLLQPRPGERWFTRAPRLALAAAAVVLAWPPLQTLIAQRQPGVDAAWAALRAGPTQWPQRPGGPFEAGIGRYLNERSAADDRIFIYETGTGVAALWTAERLPASRYLFSINAQQSAERLRDQLAELERNRPAYIVITGNPVVRHFTPFLEAHYTLAEVRDRDYRVEIWARTALAPFAAGTSAGLVDDASRNGLVLGGSRAPDDAPLVELPAPRRGSWTSPVIEVIGGGGDLAVDWSPRGAEPAVGMGIDVRYRTGPTPELDATPWVEAEEGPRVVPAQRYVQIQGNVSSRYDGRSPALQWLRIGRLRFQLDGGAEAAGEPWRTAQRAAGRGSVS